MAQKKCENCNKHSATVNYTRNGKTYYRRLCYHCNKLKKSESDLASQLLKKSGYKKKSVCDRCGFKSKTHKQMEIYYRDNNKLNVSLSNLRSFCANCIIEVTENPLTKDRDLLADY